MELQSPLAKAKGLGSAKEGGEHWIKQRFTAIFLLPLLLWLICSMSTLAAAGFEYQVVVEYFHSSLNVVAAILLISTVFYHANCGLQAIIEDYAHGEVSKALSLVLVKIFCITAASAGIFSVISVYIN